MPVTAGPSKRVSVAAIPKVSVATLRAKPVHTAPGVVNAVTAHCDMLARRLRFLNEQPSAVERSLAALVARLTGHREDAAGQPAEQRDAEILASLPGVGRTVLATLLAEGSGPLLDRDYQGLRCVCGTAAVTKRSGRAGTGRGLANWTCTGHSCREAASTVASHPSMAQSGPEGNCVK